MSTPQEREDRDFQILLEKLVARQKTGGALLLMPKEVKLLNAKLFELTQQLHMAMTFFEKYKPLVGTLARIENDINNRGGVQDPVPGSPEAVPDATDTEGLRPVAGRTDA
jgi:hypothetical protein